MIKKNCLKCEKSFEAEKETAKYCSVSCRVMYNRNNPKPKKEFSDPLVQAQVLYNAVLEMVGKVNYGILPTNLSALPVKPFIDELPMFTHKPKIKRSFENYQQLKLDCESIEAWEELKIEIMASELSFKQKTLLTN